MTVAFPLQPQYRRFSLSYGRLESDKSAAQQRLVEGKQRFIDGEHVIAPPGDEVLHDDIELAGAGQGKARLLQQLLSLIQGQLQRHGKGQCSGLAGTVCGVAANFGKQLAVNIGFLIALGICHALLVNMPEQGLGESLVQLLQRVVQAGGGGYTGQKRPARPPDA